MAKFSLEYVKKNPVMFGTIFVVFGLFLWLFLNRGSGGGGGSVIVAGPAQPSDAQVMAGMQLQAMQIQGGNQLALAQMETAARAAEYALRYDLAELEAESRARSDDSALAALATQVGAQTQLGLAQLATQADIANKDIQARLASDTLAASTSLAALTAQLDAQTTAAGMATTARLAEIASNERAQQRTTEASLIALDKQLSTTVALQESANAFAIDYATAANDASLSALAINAGLQRAMSADQLEAYKVGTEASMQNAILSQVGSLKKKDRDNFLHAFIGNTGAGSIPTRANGGGGFNPLKLVGGAVGAIAG